MVYPHTNGVRVKMNESTSYWPKENASRNYARETNELTEVSRVRNYSCVANYEPTASSDTQTLARQLRPFWHIVEHSDDFYIIASIPNMISSILQPIIDQFKIRKTSILLLSSLIWFLLSRNPFTNKLNIQKISIIFFHSVYDFWNPTTHWTL